MNPQLTIAFGFFIFAMGACIGSFLNVVIWRLPYRGREVLFKDKRGPMTLSWPPSHCPVCDAPIHWYQNIPVVSYIALRARCANCHTSIPIRYPLVELSTALVFLGFYLAYFLVHWPNPNGPILFADIRLDWPAFTLHLIFIAALLAASAIDADLYIIPLSIPYLILALGLIAALFVDSPALPHLATGANWWLARPVAGAAVGLLLVNLLLAAKIIPRSFAGENADLQAQADDPAAAAAADKQEPLAPPPKLTRFVPSAIASAALTLVSIASWFLLPMTSASLITVVSGIAIFLIGVLPRDAGQIDVTDEVLEEISAPHVRREVAKELWFLAVPLACAIIANYIPVEIPQLPWIARLLGAILGVLSGGAIVWIIRIGGTLGFNKEAMGMGDAHLMAGVGAILGCPMVLIAFLLAPFVAIAWIVILKVLGKPNVLPFGPWLSVSSILCLLVGNFILMFYLGMLGPQ